LPLLLLLVVVMVLTAVLLTRPRGAGRVLLLEEGEVGRERLSCRLAIVAFMVVLLEGEREKKRNGEGR
jgi:hypothetical protein